MHPGLCTSMLQREVVERMSAEPAARPTAGSVMLQARCEVIALLT